MKTISSFLTLTLLLFGASFLSAQPSDASVTKTKVVDASADAVWAVLRKMDDIQKYSSAVATVEWSGDHGVGGERKCLPPKDQEGFYRERIVSFSDAERKYSYAVVEGVPAQGMVNSFKVVDLGYQKSLVVWTSHYDAFMPNPNMNEEQFLGFLDQSITEMIDKVALAAL